MTIFTDEVIYQLIEEYEEYVEGIEQAQQDTILENITRPARFRILLDHTFRQNDPAVVGVEVNSGTIQNNANVVKYEGNEPTRVGQVKGIQEQGEDVDEAARNRVSVAIDGPTVGRQIEEGDELWIEIPEKHAKILEQELADEIPGDELEALNMYLDKQRSRDPFWASRRPGVRLGSFEAIPSPAVGILDGHSGMRRSIGSVHESGPGHRLGWTTPTRHDELPTGSSAGRE